MIEAIFRQIELHLGNNSEKLCFALGLHYVEGVALEIRLRFGKTQNKFWFFAQLALILQPNSRQT